MSADSMSDAIALSSPSGRMSKRARAAADRRWLERYGIRFAAPEPPTAAHLAEQLRRQAATLRDLAARGMHPRRFPKDAARLEAEADRIDPPPAS